MITPQGDYITWVFNRTGLQASELQELIKFYIPAGVYIEFEFR
jgi:hypothetical protein